MRKKVLSLVLVGAMAVTLAACGSSSSDDSGVPNESAGAEEEAELEGDANITEETVEGEAELAATSIDTSDLKVSLVMKSFNEFMNSVVDGARDACADYGIPDKNVSDTAPTNESDTMQQVTAIEDAISSGADIILNACQEENALVNVLQQAADAGIKVVMVDTDCASFEDKVTYIGTDNYEAAYEGATEFATRLEPGSNVVILRGKLGDVNHEDRTQGLTDGLEDSGMTVLEVQDANSETDKAASAMEAFMAKYPDQIDAVMVTSDAMAVGAAQAIQSAGVEGIKVCGFDGFQSAVSLIPSGQIDMIIGQKPYEMGYMGIECALGSMEGETYDSYINTGIVIIDDSNYQDYLE